MALQFKSLWESSSKLELLEVMTFIFFALLLLGLNINYPYDATIQRFSQIYLWMAVFSFIFYVGKKGKFIHTVELGKSNGMALAGFTAGMIIALLLMNATSFSIFPLSFSIGGISDYTLGSLLLGIGAAIQEARFFRGSLSPTLSEAFKNPFLGRGASVFVFGVYHVFAYQQALVLIIGAWAAAIIFEIGDFIFQSTAFEYGMHPLWNALKVLGVRRFL